MSDESRDLSQFLDYTGKQTTLPDSSPPVMVTHGTELPTGSWESPDLILLNSLHDCPVDSLLEPISDAATDTSLWLITDADDWPGLDVQLRELNWTRGYCYHLEFDTPPNPPDNPPITTAALCIHYTTDSVSSESVFVPDADDTSVVDVDGYYPSIPSHVYRWLIRSSTTCEDTVWIPSLPSETPVITSKQLGRYCYALTADSSLYRAVQNASESVPFGKGDGNTQSSFDSFDSE